MVEFKTDYPDKYILEDHALPRGEKGQVGILTVNGKADPRIFSTEEQVNNSGGH